ncbi:MAG: glycosyltransferase family 4 protein [Pseudolabrys sp.]|nr:glycosyltransferase family 4 protein [Pseudolabrys sp.]
MRSLSILHVLRAPVGGLFRHVTDLVEGQIARGHRVGIIADSLTGDARSRDTFAALVPKLALGLSLTPIPRSLGPRDLTAALHVVNRVRKTRPDVIHGHGAKGGAFARLAFARKPAIRAYTPHGGSLLLDPASVSGKAYLGAERVLMPHGDLYLFESAYSSRIFKERIGTPDGVVRVVHNGVAASEFDPVAVAPDATDLVFLGELRRVKGIDVLIDAVASLHRDGTPVTATLVGAGPEEAALRAQVTRLSLDHAIRFLPPRAARDAMAHGRIMVIPSRAESLPYVVLEAAAAGKPLITTQVGGIPEIYGPQSEELLPAGDPKALAAAVVKAIVDPEALDAITQQLRAQVVASFSLDAMLEGVLAGYEQALDCVFAPNRTLLASAYKAQA